MENVLTKTVKILLIAFVICCSTQTFAQLQVKIGNDTTFCDSYFWDGEAPQLGTNLIITGGVPPYKYVWSAKINLWADKYAFASDFLNDTTLSTPTFKDRWLDQSWETFILTVTDAENNTATDSINVRFSSFAFLLGYFVYYANAGDEILLSFISVGGGIEPYRSYSWSPPDDLLTPNERTTICRVSQSARYFITVEDSIGCSATGWSYDVILMPTSIIETELAHDGVPFIANGVLFWKNKENLSVKLNLYSLNGVKIKSVYPKSDEYCLKTNVSIPIIYEIIIGDKRYTGKYINF
jgi:hypothetical protein